MITLQTISDRLWARIQEDPNLRGRQPQPIVMSSIQAVILPRWHDERCAYPDVHVFTFEANIVVVNPSVRPVVRVFHELDLNSVIQAAMEI